MIAATLLAPAVVAAQTIWWGRALCALAWAFLVATDSSQAGPLVAIAFASVWLLRLGASPSVTRRTALHTPVHWSIALLTTVLVPYSLSTTISHSFGLEFLRSSSDAAPSSQDAVWRYIDTHGLLAAWMQPPLAHLADEMTNPLPGIGLVTLALLSVWPSRSWETAGKRRAGALLVIVFAIWWSQRRSSPHDYLMCLLRFATITHEVDRTSLNMIGLGCLLAGILPAVLFLAVLALRKPVTQCSFPWVALASLIVIAWWFTAPVAIERQLAHWGISFRAITYDWALTPLLLIVCASIGLQRIWQLRENHKWYGYLCVFLTLLVFADAFFFMKTR